MVEINLKQILSDKIRNGESANFYLVQGHGDTLDDILKVVKKAESLGELQKDHYDLLTLEGQSSSFTTADISNFDSFINTEPLNLNNKYIIINDSAKLSDVVSNKLLKTLEEPPSYLIIFLIHDISNNLIETIRSRAIEIYFTPPHYADTKSRESEFHQIINAELEISEKIVEIKKNFNLKEFLSLSSTIIQSKGPEYIDEFIKINKDALISNRFNNNNQWVYAKTLELIN